MTEFPTTRRFLRTIAEAFPNSCERACPIEVGVRPLWWRVLRFFWSFH